MSDVACSTVKPAAAAIMRTGWRKSTTAFGSHRRTSRPSAGCRPRAPTCCSTRARTSTGGIRLSPATLEPSTPRACRCAAGWGRTSGTCPTKTSKTISSVGRCGCRNAPASGSRARRRPAARRYLDLPFSSPGGEDDGIAGAKQHCAFSRRGAAVPSSPTSAATWGRATMRSAAWWRGRERANKLRLSLRGAQRRSNRQIPVGRTLGCFATLAMTAPPSRCAIAGASRRRY